METTAENNNQNLTQSKSFSYSFMVNKKPLQLFDFLLYVNNWWVGFYHEIITGDSTKLNEEFSFMAGGDIHYSKFKLVELIANQKIVWEVTDSNLSFLEETDEWTGTRMGFDLMEQDGITKITFMHFGLVPQFECYGQCTSAWRQYLDKLVERVKT